MENRKIFWKNAKALKNHNAIANFKKNAKAKDVLKRKAKTHESLASS